MWRHVYRVASASVGVHGALPWTSVAGQRRPSTAETITGFYSHISEKKSLLLEEANQTRPSLAWTFCPR